MKIPKVKRPSEEVLRRIHSLNKKKGMIAVIDPDTGKFFLGKTLLEALKQARKQDPCKVFYSIRIGYPFAHEHKGGITRI